MANTELPSGLEEQLTHNTLSTTSSSSCSEGLPTSSSCIYCIELKSQLSQLQSDHDHINYYWQVSESKKIRLMNLIAKEKAAILEEEVIRMKVELDKNLQEFIQVTGAYAELKEANALSKRQLRRVQSSLRESQLSLFHSFDVLKTFERRLEVLIAQIQERLSELRREAALMLSFLLERWTPEMVSSRLKSRNIRSIFKQKMEKFLISLLEVNEKAPKKRVELENVTSFESGSKCVILPPNKVDPSLQLTPLPAHRLNGRDNTTVKSAPTNKSHPRNLSRSPKFPEGCRRVKTRNLRSEGAFTALQTEKTTRISKSQLVSEGPTKNEDSRRTTRKQGLSPCEKSTEHKIRDSFSSVTLTGVADTISDSKRGLFEGEDQRNRNARHKVSYKTEKLSTFHFSRDSKENNFLGSEKLLSMISQVRDELENCPKHEANSNRTCSSEVQLTSALDLLSKDNNDLATHRPNATAHDINFSAKQSTTLLTSIQGFQIRNEEVRRSLLNDLHNTTAETTNAVYRNPTTNTQMPYIEGQAVRNDALNDAMPSQLESCVLDTPNSGVSRVGLVLPLDSLRGVVPHRERRAAKNMSRTRPNRDASKITWNDDIVGAHRQEIDRSGRIFKVIQPNDRYISNGQMITNTLKKAPDALTQDQCNKGINSCVENVQVEEPTYEAANSAGKEENRNNRHEPYAQSRRNKEPLRRKTMLHLKLDCDDFSQSILPSLDDQVPIMTEPFHNQPRQSDILMSNKKLEDFMLLSNPGSRSSTKDIPESRFLLPTKPVPVSFQNLSNENSLSSQGFHMNIKVDRGLKSRGLISLEGALQEESEKIVSRDTGEPTVGTEFVSGLRSSSMLPNAPKAFQSNIATRRQLTRPAIGSESRHKTEIHRYMKCPNPKTKQSFKWLRLDESSPAKDGLRRKSLKGKLLRFLFGQAKMANYISIVGSTQRHLSYGNGTVLDVVRGLHSRLPDLDVFHFIKAAPVSISSARSSPNGSANFRSPKESFIVTSLGCNNEKNRPKQNPRLESQDLFTAVKPTQALRDHNHSGIVVSTNTSVEKCESVPRDQIQKMNDITRGTLFNLPTGSQLSHKRRSVSRNRFGYSQDIARANDTLIGRLITKEQPTSAPFLDTSALNDSQWPSTPQSTTVIESLAILAGRVNPSSHNNAWNRTIYRKRTSIKDQGYRCGVDYSKPHSVDYNENGVPPPSIRYHYNVQEAGGSQLNDNITYSPGGAELISGGVKGTSIIISPGVGLLTKSIVCSPFSTSKPLRQQNQKLQAVASLNRNENEVYSSVSANDSSTEIAKIENFYGVDVSSSITFKHLNTRTSRNTIYNSSSNYVNPDDKPVRYVDLTSDILAQSIGASVVSAAHSVNYAGNHPTSGLIRIREIETSLLPTSSVNLHDNTPASRCRLAGHPNIDPSQDFPLPHCKASYQHELIQPLVSPTPNETLRYKLHLGHLGIGSSSRLRAASGYPQISSCRKGMQACEHLSYGTSTQRSTRCGVARMSQSVNVPSSFRHGINGQSPKRRGHTGDNTVNACRDGFMMKSFTTARSERSLFQSSYFQPSDPEAVEAFRPITCRLSPLKTKTVLEGKLQPLKIISNCKKNTQRRARQKKPKQSWNSS